MGDLKPAIVSASTAIVEAVGGPGSVLASAYVFEGGEHGVHRVYLLVDPERAGAIVGASGANMERVRCLVRMRATVEGWNDRVDVKALSDPALLPNVLGRTGAPNPDGPAWERVGLRRWIVELADDHADDRGMEVVVARTDDEAELLWRRARADEAVGAVPAVWVGLPASQPDAKYGYREPPVPKVVGIEPWREAHRGYGLFLVDDPTCDECGERFEVVHDDGLCDDCHDQWSEK